MKNALLQAPWLSAMARVFEQEGEVLYIVGGAVRNPLMDLPLSDVDVCGPARPERVAALCEGTPIKAVLRAAHFGTVELHLTDAQGAHHMAEYTTFREDSYRCGHRPETVRFATDVAVDALRRDFSVNALYRRVYDGALGEVIDPTGGLTHLNAGVLHTVTLDPDQVLKDDGLRILRAARFQAELGLSPTEALRQSLRRHAPLLGDIACERLRDELQKTLLADLRYPQLKRSVPGTYSGLCTIAQAGAWPYLFGSLPFDAEAAQALARFDAGALPSLPARMALLMRLAAPETAAALMARLRFAARDGALTQRFLSALHLSEQDAVPPFEAAQLGADAFCFARAAAQALGEVRAQAHAQAALDALVGVPASLRELCLSGDDLLPLFKAHDVPLREMGALLSTLWRMAVERALPNERGALLRAAEGWVRERCPR